MIETIVVIGTLSLGASAIGYGWNYQTKKLNAEYGPQFTANLLQTEEAIKACDYDKARLLFEERKRLFTDSNKKFEGWLMFAKPEIRDALNKSLKLEDRLDLLGFGN